MRTRRVLPAILCSACVGLVLACGGIVRNAPRPSTGAATPEELVAAYRRAHEAGDPQQFRQFDLTLALLPEWGPVNGEYAAELRRLFRLRLDDVRYVPAPEGMTDDGLFYLSRKPNGEPSVDNLLGDVRGRIVLAGRRPDGAAVTVEPGFGVVQADGRFYLEALRRVLQLEGKAIEAGRPPVCRAFPFGTGGRFIAQDLDAKDWERANRQFDEIERLARAGQPLPE
jgi:hypothetical protein